MDPLLQCPEVLGVLVVAVDDDLAVHDVATRREGELGEVARQGLPPRDWSST